MVSSIFFKSLSLVNSIYLTFFVGNVKICNAIIINNQLYRPNEYTVKRQLYYLAQNVADLLNSSNG